MISKRSGRHAAMLAAFFLLTTAAYAEEKANRFSLKESLKTALKKSVKLHAAQEGRGEAEARKMEAFADFLPKLSTSYNYTKLNKPPYFNFPGFPPLVPPAVVVTGTEDNYYWALEVKQPIFAGGAIKAGYEIGRINEDIARIVESTVKYDLVLEIKTAYFRILKAQRILEVAKQNLEGLKTHRDQAQIFYDLGFIPRNDLLAAEVELADGKQFLLKAQNGVELAKSGFNILLRRDINAPLEVEDILKYQSFDKAWEECLEAALKNRTELIAADLQVKQVRWTVKQAESDYYPMVNFWGNYSKYGDEPRVSGSAYKDEDSWYVALTANWSIWEGGRTKSRVEASKSRERQAVDSFLNLHDRIVMEVKNAYLSLKEAEQQMATSRNAVLQAEENFRITMERYREQVARASDVIDAQTVLTRAKSDYFNALGDYNIGLAVLERVMGVGTAEAEDEVPPGMGG